ncbi:MAG: NADH-quinone oxidoreductase subunit NuoN [Parvibaculaceae bacterium]
MENAHLVPAFGPAIPEIVLAAGAMLLLMYGVFRKVSPTVHVAYGVVVLFIVTAFLVAGQGTLTETTFSGLFSVDPYTRFVKLLILLGAATAVIMSLTFIRREGMDRFEFPVLIALATVGMMMMVSAASFMSLYMGLELQSLAIYVIAAFHRDNAKSSEAGLKYFVLGALSSGLLLYGCSLVYGYTGVLDFVKVAAAISADHQTLGLIFGLVFILAALAFKISAVPFHMWTPDVYEGAPTPVTAFLAGAPKVAALALTMRVLFTAFPAISPEWNQIVVFVAVASMLLGSFAAIGQNSIKRLMAYSSIGHMGFALVGVAAGTVDGVKGVLIYLTIYVIMNAGVFCCILAMRRNGQQVETINDLAGLSRTRPVYAFFFAMLMFSLAGIPPLAGFFAKFYVFIAAVDAGLFALAVIGIVTSVVGAFYYLRVIKIMYFDEPIAALDGPMPRELSVVLGLSGLFIMLFWALPAPLLVGAQAAAAALVH